MCKVELALRVRESDWQSFLDWELVIQGRQSWSLEDNSKTIIWTEIEKRRTYHDAKQKADR